MYLCNPAKEAVQNWRALLSEDAPDLLMDLKDALDRIDLDSEKELKDLLWEYTRLFIGPYKLPCPPWESVYTSPKRLMMQEAYDEVKYLYGEAGLTVKDPGIMYDHIGAELNFLAVLMQGINKEPGERQYADIAKRFMNEHLTKWIPQFAGDMEDAADTQLYRTLAQATRDFIKHLQL